MDIGADIYTTLKPVALTLAAIGLIWLAKYLFGESVEAFARACVKEFRELIQGRWTLKALNALGMILVVIVVAMLLFSGAGDRFAKDVSDVAIYRFAERLGYAVIIIIALALCLFETRSERR